jgi:hypothetical protein
MRRDCTVFRRLHVMLATACVAGAVLPAVAGGDKTRDARASEAAGRLPLAFEANRGQTDARVTFLSRGRRYTMFLTRDGAVLSLNGTALEMTVVGGNPRSAITGVDRLSGTSSYFIAKDPASWHVDVPSYGTVRYAEIYPGVDLLFHGSNQRQLEYDFVIGASVDPRIVRLRFRGAQHLTIDETGALVIHTASGDVIERAPVAYQDIKGARRRVDVRYEMRGKHEVGFRVAPYDRRRPLTIDPVLVYSTFLGGAGFDQANAVALDTAGNVYVAVESSSPDFPKTFGTPAARGTFVTKFSPSGNALIYSAYIGGADEAAAIALDRSGSAYITGRVCSNNLPTVNAFQTALAGSASFGVDCDAFVIKLSPAGDAIVYSTYLGGYCGDTGHGIGVDAAGNTYVAGDTGGNYPCSECAAAGFPVVNALQPAPGGLQDAFVAKLDPTGSRLLFSTYLGGPADDIAWHMALDPAGNVYVGGGTRSSNFPTVNPIHPCGSGQDAFVTKLTPGGDALVYSTCVGGDFDEEAIGLAIDASGAAYITGQTGSLDFPSVNAFQPAKAGLGGGRDAFVTKLSPAGDSIVYSTFLGGSLPDIGMAIAVDPAGNAYVTGQAVSPDFPTVNPIQATKRSSGDVFITRVSAAGDSLTYSTYLGGSGFSGQTQDDFGMGIAVDGAGNAYVVGLTSSADFPTVNAFQPTEGGAPGFDGFLAKIAPGVPAPAPPVASAGIDGTVPEGWLVMLDGAASFDPNIDPLTYRWEQIGGPAVTLSNASAMRPTFTAPGVLPGGATLTFRLTVNDGTIASAPDTVNITVTNINQAPVADAGPDQTVRAGSPVTLDGRGTFDADGDRLISLWIQTVGPEVTLSDPSVLQPTFTAPSTGGVTLRFLLLVNDGAEDAGDAGDEVQIVVVTANQAPTANAGSDQTVDEGATVTLTAAASADPDGDRITYSWTQLSGLPVTLVDPASAQPRFAAPSVGAVGATLVFQVIVGDGTVTGAPDTVTITVRDANQPPSCGLAQASSNPLWPPNHKLVSVAVQGVSDPEDRDVRITITGVTQNEPLNGLGDGDTAPDAVLQGASVLLRAERSGLGTGRIYTVTFSAIDTQGAACAGSIAVCVPHDRGTNACSDTGLRYNSLVR